MIFRSFHVPFVYITGEIGSGQTPHKPALVLHQNKGRKKKRYNFSAEGETEKLPFKITVESFSIEKYPGSDAPMDYVSNITIDDKGETVKGIVSMNNILKYRNFRFYQNGIDESSDEVGLLVSYDPVGIGITYGCGFYIIPKLYMDKSAEPRCKMGPLPARRC